jgi:hypothetical protein
VRAIRFSSDKTPVLRSSRRDSGASFLQQKWQIRVPGEMNNLAPTAEMLLHEMDLKVA